MLIPFPSLVSAAKPDEKAEASPESLLQFISIFCLTYIFYHYFYGSRSACQNKTQVCDLISNNATSKTIVIPNNMAKKCGKRCSNVLDGTFLLPCNKKKKSDYTGDCIEKKEQGYEAEDRISWLPEDILANIVCRLTMKEATCTSVLSSKWRHLWTLFDGCLDFDASLTVRDLRENWGLGSKPLHIERARFLSWVNGVLNSHRSPTIEELRICFDVDSKSDIDSWIKFAIEKRVQRLELDLKSSQLSTKKEPNYAFPSYLLSPSSFSSLTSLLLTSVDVNGEVLEYLLSHCPFLEVLRVIDSACLVSLKVCGSSLKLKYLEIRRCHQLKDLEISAVDLVSFKYSGPRITFPLKYAPRLVELSMVGSYCNYITRNLHLLTGYVMQLETLILDVGGAYVYKKFPENLPELSNLKHLELITAISGPEYSLLPFASLLEASPLLYKFTLKLDFVERSSRELQEVTEKHSCPCLKVVELVGFGGVIAEMEFLLYLLKNAVVLEKLIINPCLPCCLGSSLEYKFRETERYQLARQHAMALRAGLPPGVEYVVL